MKVLVCKEAGNIESLSIVDRNLSDPKDNQVQIKVKAVSLSTSDIAPFTQKVEEGTISFAAKFMVNNKALGGDISGIITKVGKRVNHLKVGDEVYSAIGVNGGCCEFVNVNTNKVFIKPNNLTFEQAASIPTSAIVAMEACKKAKIHKDTKVLIYGSSGGVGTMCLQIAKAMGATITAVCSTRNVQTMYELGANHVIDYKKENIENHTETYNVILRVNGNIKLSTYKRLLSPHGTYIAIGGKSATAGILGPLYALGSNKHMSFVLFAFAQNHGHLNTITSMIENNEIQVQLESVFTPKEAKNKIQQIAIHHTKGKNVIKTEF